MYAVAACFIVMALGLDSFSLTGRHVTFERGPGVTRVCGAPEGSSTVFSLAYRPC
jgi:hypothetical protein